MVSQLAGWNLDTMALELATCLRGSAVEILGELELQERIHYPTLKSALCDRYEAENQCQVFRAQLKGRVRKNDESLSELAHEIGKLVRKGYTELSPSMRDTIAKDAFLEALCDRELELAVFQSHSRSLQDAVKAAIEYESFRSTRQRKSLGAIRECVSQEESEYGSRIIELEKQLQALRVAKTGDRVSDVKEDGVDKGSKRCFLCNGLGHFKANCPKKPAGKTATTTNRKTMLCDYCGKSGHTMQSCWKYQNEFKGVQVCMYCGKQDHFMIDCPSFQAHKGPLKGEKLV